MELGEIVMGVISVWLGANEYRLRSLQNKVNSTADRKEIHGLIDLKVESLKLMQGELKEDLKRIEHKLDKLLTK